MDRIKSLIREPALLIDFAETLVVMLVAFGLGLSGDQQTYIVAAVVGVLGLLKAFMTKPFAVAAVTDAARAVLALAMSFGVGLNADQIALIVTALGTLITIVVRAQVTPTYDPIVVAGGAGAGPVPDAPGRERGAVDTRMIAIAALVIAVVVVLVLVF